MIAQRIISEIIYLSMLLIVCYLISKSKKYKNIKHLLFIYLIFIIAMSYKFKPVIDMDLVYYKNDIVNYYSQLSPDELLNNVIYKNKHLGILLFYSIGKIGNLELLQVSASVISYAVLFYILYNYGYKKNMNPKTISIVLFFLMISIRFVFVISNIRCPIAIATFSLALYCDILLNKNVFKCLPLYIISIGFHIALIPAVLIRFIYLLFQKEKNNLIKIANYVAFIVITFVFITNLNLFFEGISNKINYYLPSNHYFSYYNYFLMLTRFVFIIFNVYIYNKVFKEKNLLQKKYYSMYTIMLLFNIITITKYTIFERYSLLLVYLSIPILLENYNFIMNNKSVKSLTKYEFLNNLIIIFIFISSFAFSDMKLLNFF